MFAKRIHLNPKGVCTLFFIFLFFIVKPPREKIEGQKSNFYLSKIEQNALPLNLKLLFILDDEEQPSENGSQTQRLAETISSPLNDLIVVSTARLIKTAFSIPSYRSLMQKEKHAWTCRKISSSFYCFIPRAQTPLSNEALGIKHHHFPARSFRQLENEVKTNRISNQLPHFFEDFGIRKKRTSSFFVTRHESKKQPPLLIMITGHGQPCSPIRKKIPQEELPPFPTQAPFLKKDGFMCGLAIKKMRKLILFCKEQLNVKAILFSTCGGARLSERLIYSSKKRAFRDLPFHLICRGCTDAPTFLVPFDSRELLKKTSTVEALLEQISLDDGTPTPNHLALIKAPNKDRFMLYQPKNCFFVASDEFNENTTTPFVITCPPHKKLFILLGEPFIQRPLVFDSSVTTPTILSVWPGSTVHIVNKIDARGLPLNKFLVSFFKLINSEERKLFIIKKLTTGDSELHQGSRSSSHTFSNVYLKQEWDLKGKIQRSILIQDHTTSMTWEGVIITEENRPAEYKNIVWRRLNASQSASILKSYEATKDALLSHLIEHRTFGEQQ